MAMGGRIKAWWKRKQTALHLAMLDDRVLADMGICRRHLETGRCCAAEECSALRNADIPAGAYERVHGSGTDLAVLTRAN